MPLTFANVFHVDNFAPRPGEDLLLDLTNGLVFYRGSRFEISPLKIAMLRDADVSATYIVGDYDVDGTVNDSDYILSKNAFGSTADPFVDGNRDGRVDAADFTAWRDNLSVSMFSDGSGAIAAVPEPANW